MNVRTSRIIEFCFSFLVSFLVLSVISFLTLRPALKEVRVEARAEWDGFIRAVKERNELLPGLTESVKGFEPGQTKLAERLLEARSISLRTSDPAGIVAAVDDIERSLVQIENLSRTRPGLDQYPPFANYWRKVVRQTHRISSLRSTYNSNVKFYNRLLAPFPQNLLTAAFGFVPLADYPSPQTVSDVDLR
ncbi:MAG: LemA family protein [Desulfomonile tiedjei]|uniref:LemA family protein n=1 Tax=Desulfomonile tiedjei TaxID=2358 RepID=A0A9D6Z294_9BACT|nr:LemA family protein [Desulfomonile tiedjei]